MSRVRQRPTGSRRTPVKPGGEGSGGRQLPMVPIMMVLAVLVVGGLIGYLIWQQGKDPSDLFSGAVRAEANSDPSLPGEYVNLPEIYDGFYSNPEGANTNAHVTRDVDYKTEQGLPPTGGAHWGSSACGNDPDTAPSFCGPAPWGVFNDPWDAETLVHNMEHGGVVVWYNTTDEAAIADLADLVEDRLNRRLIVMSPYPEMEDEFIAVTSWSRRLLIPVEDYDRDIVDDFFDVNERRFNPEGF